MMICCKSRSSSSATVSNHANGGSAGAKTLNISRPDPNMMDDSVAQFSAHRSPESCGVGIFFKLSESGDMEVEGVIPGGPADRTGKLRIGDQLVRVDGRFVRGKPASQIAPKILGPAGTIVELSFKREQGPAVMTVNVAIVREPPRGEVSCTPSRSRSPVATDTQEKSGGGSGTVSLASSNSHQHSDSRLPAHREGMLASSVREGMLASSVREGMLASSVREGMLASSVREGMLASSVREGMLASSLRDDRVLAESDHSMGARNSRNSKGGIF